MTTLKIPLPFEEWCCDTDIEGKYQRFHDEYGDAACLLSEYKRHHYEEYLAGFPTTIEGGEEP